MEREIRYILHVFTTTYSILSLKKKALDIQKNISIIRFNGSRNMMVIFLEVKEQGSRAAIQ